MAKQMKEWFEPTNLESVTLLSECKVHPKVSFLNVLEYLRIKYNLKAWL